MPTYEYTCKKCLQRIEVFQPFSAKPLKKHRDCDGELQKVFHSRGVLFKGSGFYVTDSRRTDKEPSSKEPSSKEPSSKEPSSKEPAAKSNGAKEKPAPKKSPEPAAPSKD